MDRLAKTRRYIPHIIILVAIFSLIGFLARPKVLSGDPEGDIPFEMPLTLGPYTGEEMYFCQNDQCAKPWVESELKELAAAAPDPASATSVWKICSFCTNNLGCISIGEQKLLPPDTPIFRRFYTCHGKLPVQATVVFSGSERRSIHRPQICLVAQGNQLINEYNYNMSIGDGRRMPIRVIELMDESTDSSGVKVRRNAVYAYWFFNPHMQTPSHIKRIMRVILDNALFSYRPRWAYVSMAIPLPQGENVDFRDTLDSFGPEIYRELEKLRKIYRDRETAASK